MVLPCRSAKERLEGVPIRQYAIPLMKMSLGRTWTWTDYNINTCEYICEYCMYKINRIHKQIYVNDGKWERLTWNFMILVEPMAMDSKRL